MDYTAEFSAVIASCEPESAGHLPAVPSSALDKSWLSGHMAQRIFERAKRFVLEGFDEPHERKAIADGAVDALRAKFPETDEAILELLSQALAQALAVVAEMGS
jgi:hypothetical protein